MQYPCDTGMESWIIYIQIYNILRPYTGEQWWWIDGWMDGISNIAQNGTDITSEW